MSDEIGVLIADDHSAVRMGLRRKIEYEDDMTVVSTAANGKEAVDLTRETSPDVVLMDIRMPEMSGVEATEKITAEHLCEAVIGISAGSRSNRIEAMQDAGAVDFFEKSRLDTLRKSIRKEATNAHSSD